MVWHNNVATTEPSTDMSMSVQDDEGNTADPKVPPSTILKVGCAKCRFTSCTRCDPQNTACRIIKKKKKVYVQHTIHR